LGCQGGFRGRLLIGMRRMSGIEVHSGIYVGGGSSVANRLDVGNMFFACCAGVEIRLQKGYLTLARTCPHEFGLSTWKQNEQEYHRWIHVEVQLHYLRRKVTVPSCPAPCVTCKSRVWPRVETLKFVLTWWI